MTSYYHYTTQDHCSEIQDCGVINPVESNVSMKKEHAGPDVVWLFNEPLKIVPRMLYSPLLIGHQEEGTHHPTIEEQQRMFTGVWVPKTQIEIEVQLDRNEVQRADKFLKKHNIESQWMSSLETIGGMKLTKQYVIPRAILDTEIKSYRTREDLMEQRTHSYRDIHGNDTGKRVKF